MARKQARPQRNPRLDASDWIEAALDALADGGIEALRVEPLAKSLAVTKGSFYWHFPDRRALLDAALQSWAQGRLKAIREQSAREADPQATLRYLAGLYATRANVRGLSIELAIRALARSDAAAARAVRAVDLERLKRVGDLFAGLGWSAREAQARAVLFYSYLFGESLLDPGAVPAKARDTAVAALVAAPAPQTKSARRPVADLMFE